MAEASLLRISVLLAESRGQSVVSLELPPGAAAWQAVEASGLLRDRVDLDPPQLAVAVFGRQVPREHELEDGDRVEILRPLHEDPKQRRRRKARAGESVAARGSTR